MGAQQNPRQLPLLCAGCEAAEQVNNSSPMPFSQDKINDLLKKEDKSEFEVAVLKELDSYLRSSSEKMSEYWESWRRADESYRGFLEADKQDAKDAADKKPTKVLVPITYAQIQTATSFVHSTFSQKERLFELTGSGSEDVANSEAMETDLNYQVDKSKLMVKLYAFILDNFKYGISVGKVTWEKETCQMRVAKKQPAPVSPIDQLKKLFGGAGGAPKMITVESVEEVLKYEGNCVTNVSPYNFLPDPNLPVARFQEGQFCAFEEMVSRDKILAGEGKQYYGTKHIKEIKKDVTQTQERRRYSTLIDDATTPVTAAKGKVNRESMIFTEIQFSLTPSDWNEKFKEAGIDFGDEEYPMKFVAVIANDNKLIKFEPLGYLHNKFTYVVSEFLPDHNNFISHGLAECIHELQALMTWFYNSHVTNVKRNIKNQFVANTESVNVEDLTENRSVIRIKTKPGVDVNNAVKQLAVTDVTSGHVSDANSIFTLIQTVTGVSDNALGQYAPGRRSAFESRQVTAGAAMRLKMHAVLMWNTGIEPLGQMMLSNTRQMRSKDVYDRIVGPKRAQENPFETTILADSNQISGGYDFMPYDGTLPSEKNSQAQILNELFTTLISNPAAGQALGIDARKLLARIGELLGIKDLENIGMAPVPGAPVPPMPGMPPAAPEIPGGQPPLQADGSSQQILSALSGQ
jgi:hypothetical protein